ncbi:hypothetical protein RF11_06288 [Thelohanellus kitauei]|uniref:Uncharacterized protein n=1 Tax=Thelohanellus kitauei TaxID=669202 RepID=A0A0C2N2H7_THEKT|nr:hypothetical protein RF11_06288 [Thelohanellus kitauei]
MNSKLMICLIIPLVSALQDPSERIERLLDKSVLAASTGEKWTACWKTTYTKPLRALILSLFEASNSYPIYSSTLDSSLDGVLVKNITYTLDGSPPNCANFEGFVATDQPYTLVVDYSYYDGESTIRDKVFFAFTVKSQSAMMEMMLDRSFTILTLVVVLSGMIFCVSIM